MITFLTIIIIAFFLVPSIYAQVPVVNADHTVTFTYYAPNAKKVLLSGTCVVYADSLGNKIKGVVGKKKHPKIKMQKEGDVWTCTTQQLPSEMYTYRYIVDGKAVIDSLNPNVTRDIAEYFNFFFVDGDIATHYIDKDIPHGKLSFPWYYSTLNGMSQRRMAIYTPAEYAKNPNKKYPVLYLLHGSGGDETAWSDYGRACQILDDMIASGQCVPMIVVMPNGNVKLDAAPGCSEYMEREPTANNMASMLGKFETSFVKEIVGYVEKNYRTINDKSHRAIAGLSLGGLHTLFTSLNNPDHFDYVGLFSAQVTQRLDLDHIRKVEASKHNLERLNTLFALFADTKPRSTLFYDRFEEIEIYNHLEEKLDRQFQNPPKVYYMAIGNEDFLQTMNAHYRELLDKKGIKYEFHLTSGDHCWENWRKYLVEFLPKLFLCKEE